MNKNEKFEYCLLWQEARDLAMEKGLQMSLTCPMDSLCSGEKCVFIDPRKKVHEIIYKCKQEPVIGC